MKTHVKIIFVKWNNYWLLYQFPPLWFEINSIVVSPLHFLAVIWLRRLIFLMKQLIFRWFFNQFNYFEREGYRNFGIWLLVFLIRFKIFCECSVKSHLKMQKNVYLIYSFLKQLGHTYHMYNIYWVTEYVKEHIKICARESRLHL